METEYTNQGSTKDQGEKKVDGRILEKIDKMRRALRYCRDEARLTQDEMRPILKKYGIEIKGANSISNWENGPGRVPNLEVLHAYSEEFDKDLRFIMGDIDHPLMRGSIIDVGNDEFEEMWRAAPPETQHDVVEYFRFRLQSDTGKLSLPKAVNESPEVSAVIEKLIAALAQVV